MDAAKATRAVVAVATSMVLLSGCVQGRQAPAGGVGDEELARYQDYVGGQMWERTGLPGSMRPDVEPVYIQIEDWSDALNACETIRVNGVESNASGTAIVVSEYSCRIRYQLSGAQLGLLNEAQLDYLYDYYQDTLVPCLRLRGVEVPEVLTRAEAVDIGRFGAYPWNPYGAMTDFTRGDRDDEATWAACPAFPPDAAFDRYWEP